MRLQESLNFLGFLSQIPEDIVVFSAMKYLTLEKRGGCFYYLDLLKYGCFNQWKNKEKYKICEFGTADKVVIIHLWWHHTRRRGRLDACDPSKCECGNLDSTLWWDFVGGGSLGNSQTGTWVYMTTSVSLEEQKTVCIFPRRVLGEGQGGSYLEGVMLLFF